MSRLFMLTLTALVALAGPCLAQAKVTPLAKQAAENNNDFALRLYAELAKKDGNLFFSPHSISTALAMTYAGARGNTAEEMKTTLRLLQPVEELHPAFHDLQEHLLGKDAKRKFELQVANRLFGQKDHGFLPEFLKVGSTFYGAGLEEVDFKGETEAARKLINAWVEKQTKDKIKDLLKEGILTSDSRLVLANAIYFKAAWNREFSAKNTKPGEFFLEGGAGVKTPMMQQHWRTGYFKGDGIEVVEMPYEGRQLSLIVALPEKGTPLAKLEAGLTQVRLKKWLEGLRDHLVDLQFPKFKQTSEFALKDTLSSLGMKEAFVPGAADFSGMSSGPKLFISHVIHKAFIDVNEKGTEAAAATAVGVEITSAPLPATFAANRPFVYLIRDNASGAILFVGRVMDPSK